MPRKIPELPERFQQSIFKAQVRRGVPEHVISSFTVPLFVDGEVAGRLTLSILRCQKVWGYLLMIIK